MSHEPDRDDSFNFTAEALAAINEALRSLRRQGKSECDVEDLLYGLLWVRDSSAAKILRRQGYNVFALRMALRAGRVGIDDDDNPDDSTLRYRYTERALEIRERARDICLSQSGHDYVGPLHLLAAIIRHGDAEMQAWMSRYTDMGQEQADWVLDRRLNFKTNLSRRVGWQEAAADDLADGIKRSHKDRQDARQPIGVFLLAGPADVGQADLATATAEHLFGDEDRVVRITMADPGRGSDASRLVGSTHVRGGQLTDGVSQARTCVVLLQEIDEASSEDLEILARIFDGDNTYTDSDGKEVDFRHSVFLLTSSAGAGEAYIASPRESSGADASESAGRDGELSPRVARAIESAFPPDFRARIDAVIELQPLVPGDLAEILNSKYAVLEGQLVPHRVFIEPTQITRDWFIERELDHRTVAKTMLRLFDDHLATPLFRGIGDGTYRGNSIVKVDVAGGDLVLIPDRPNELGDLFLAVLREQPIQTLLLDCKIDVWITSAGGEWLADQVDQYPEQAMLDAATLSDADRLVARRFGRSKIHAARQVVNRYLASPLLSWYLMLGIDEGGLVQFDGSHDEWTISLTTIDILLKLTDSGEHAWWMRGDVPATIGVPIRRVVDDGVVPEAAVSYPDDYVPKDLLALLERWAEEIPQPVIKWALAQSSELGLHWPARASGSWLAYPHHPSQVRHEETHPEWRQPIHDREEEPNYLIEPDGDDAEDAS